MNKSLIHKRINSLDIFRGAIIILLLLESVEFFEMLAELFDDNIILSPIINQFFHARWAGLTFWDIIQPGFMYIAGVAMALSFTNRMAKGESYKKWIIHILKRSAILFIFGVGLHWVYNEGVVFEFQNVLTQLALTTIIAALIIRKKPFVQFTVSLGLILLTSIIYRLYNSGNPFMAGKNAGTAFDMIISGHADSDYWVSLNFLPTSAHTIWGVITGLILIGKQAIKDKIKTISIASVSLIVVGLFLHFSNIEPMIKRIATASFVMVSGAIVALSLLALFIVVDEGNKEESKLMRFFTIPGKNSIFIYLFSQIVIPLFLLDFISIFTEGILEILKIPNIAHILTVVVTLIIVNRMLLWLTKNNITVHI